MLLSLNLKVPGFLKAVKAGLNLIYCKRLDEFTWLIFKFTPDKCDGLLA
jgi:hypothetical protein